MSIYLIPNLTGESEVAALLNAPLSTCKQEPKSWEDAQQIYYYALSIFFKIGSYLLYGLCMTDLSKRVWVDSKHALSDSVHLQTQRIFHENLLARSINAHRKDTATYYLQSPVATFLKTKPKDALHFFHAHGICRGMDHWFIYLYLKARTQFADSDQLMHALGKQYEEGAPTQAAFLQSLQLDEVWKLLNLNVQPNFSRIDTQNKTHAEIVQSIRNNPPGIYGIYIADHMLVHIHLSPETHYLFDPNKGVFKVNSPLVFHLAMQTYLQKHNPTKPILVDLYC